jgi:hypothetical protein
MWRAGGGVALDAPVRGESSRRRGRVGGNAAGHDAGYGPAEIVRPIFDVLQLDSDWTLEEPTPGHFVWNAPTGATFTVTPEPLAS